MFCPKGHPITERYVLEAPKNRDDHQAWKAVQADLEKDRRRTSHVRRPRRRRAQMRRERALYNF